MFLLSEEGSEMLKSVRSFKAEIDNIICTY